MFYAMKSIFLFDNLFSNLCIYNRKETKELIGLACWVNSIFVMENRNISFMVSLLHVRFWEMVYSKNGKTWKKIHTDSQCFYQRVILTAFLKTWYSFDILYIIQTVIGDLHSEPTKALLMCTDLYNRGFDQAILINMEKRLDKKRLGMCFLNNFDLYT